MTRLGYACTFCLDFICTCNDEKIVGAAIYLNEEVHALPKPLRHHHIIRFLADRGFKTPIGGVQGFVTSRQRFVGREEARKIAVASKQVRENETRHDRELFTEDLW